MSYTTYVTVRAKACQTAISLLFSQLIAVLLCMYVSMHAHCLHWLISTASYSRLLFADHEKVYDACLV